MYVPFVRSSYKKHGHTSHAKSTRSLLVPVLLLFETQSPAQCDFNSLAVHFSAVPENLSVLDLIS